MSATLLNDDLHLEILSRLPIRSLFRFKCVSKQWHSLASEAYSKKPTQLGLVGGSDNPLCDSCRFISTKHDHATLENSSGVNCKDDDAVLDSCNGLLLYRCGNSFIVYNPLTKQSTSFARKKPERFFNAFLVFDPRVSPHFKVIVVIFQHWWFYIFSSETGRYSSYLTIYLYYLVSILIERPRVCMNGIAYMLVNGRGLLKFCMESNKFELVALPIKPDFEVHLGECRGDLVCVTVGLMHLNIWVLKNCASNEWEMKHEVGLLCLLGLRPNDANQEPVHALTKCYLGVHRDKQVVFVRLCKRVFSYDYSQGRLEELCTLPNGSHVAYVFAASLHNPPPVKNVRKWWFW